MLKIFNTLTKEKEEFHSIHKDSVGMYTCGPTVYNYPHIGNYRAYLFGDLLKRYLQYLGYHVKHVMNITDVDDKTIRDSQKEGKGLKEFTEFYTKGFYEDLDILNIKKAESFPKATHHVPEMVEMIKKLLEKGMAYKGEDGCIYYNIRRFIGYGKLSGFQIEELQEDASGRMKNDEYGKENARDFALWKAYDESDGNVFWDTEIGKGRPGWHIECSAMSTKYLGQPFDIHAGGVDLIFPHHENEIAQSEGCCDKKFVNYWAHNEWLLVEGKKMSKSLGNFYTLRDILAKGYSPKAVRYLLMSTHYRTQLNFTFEGLKSSETIIEKFKEFMLKMEEPHSGLGVDLVKLMEDMEIEFRNCMDDDLNISAALAPIFEFMKQINVYHSDGKLSEKNSEEILDFMGRIDRVLGIMDFVIDVIPDEIKALAELREKARKNKDFKQSDELRDMIKEKGYQVDDTSKGIRIKKI